MESPSAERPNGGRLYTNVELASRWQVPTSQVNRLAREGKLDAVKIGRYRRFTAAVVERFEEDGGADA